MQAYVNIYIGETALVITLNISSLKSSLIHPDEPGLACLFGVGLVFPCALLLEQMGLSLQKGSQQSALSDRPSDCSTKTAFLSS